MDINVQGILMTMSFLLLGSVLANITFWLDICVAFMSKRLFLKFYFWSVGRWVRGCLFPLCNFVLMKEILLGWNELFITLPVKILIFQEGLDFPVISLIFFSALFIACSMKNLLPFSVPRLLNALFINCCKFFPSLLESGLWSLSWSRLKESTIIWDVFICLRIWMNTRITCCELKMKKKNIYVIYPMLFQNPLISYMVNEVLRVFWCCLMADHKVLETF